MDLSSFFHTIRRRIKRSVIYYSRLISLAKIWLMSISALALGILFIYPQVMEHKKLFNLTFSSDFLDDAQSIKITNIRYTAVDKRNKPITVTSELAEERVPGSKILFLVKPAAILNTQEDDAIHISSQTGFFDQNTEKLVLKENVEIISSKGYEIYTQEIDFDIKKKTISSTKEIQARGDFGTLVAAGILITDNGDKVIFTGETKLELFEKRNK